MISVNQEWRQPQEREFARFGERRFVSGDNLENDVDRRLGGVSSLDHHRHQRRKPSKTSFNGLNPPPCTVMTALWLHSSDGYGRRLILRSLLTSFFLARIEEKWELHLL